MRRLGTDEWAGLAMLVVAVLVASPSLFGAAETHIPHWAWAATLLVFAAAFLLSVMATSASRLVGYAIGVVASWVLVLTTDIGLVLILLVIAAALSVYVVPLRWGVTVVILNTGIVAIAHLQQERPPIEVTMMVGFYLLIQLASLFSTAALVREQRLRAELAAAHVDLQAASVLLAESARSAERLRISRELHDLIGHQLTALTLQLETARHVDAETARQHIDNADTVARELLRDVRVTVDQLREPVPDLAEVLWRIGDGIPGLAVTIEVGDVPHDERLGTALVRATQEVITNAVRHADAGAIRVEIESDAEFTTFHARDDGRGAPTPVFGNGLRGLSERFAELGGTLEVDGSAGFRVTARVPRR